MTMPHNIRKPRNIQGLTRDTTEPQNLGTLEPPIPSPVIGMIISAIAGLGAGITIAAFLL